jgi:hypothetical protein
MKVMQPAPPPPQAPKSPTPPPAPRGNAGRRFLTIVFLIALAFLGGFVPQWLEVRRLRTEVERTDLQFRLLSVHRLLGMASQTAQRGQYPDAQKFAVQFFDEAATLARTDAFEREQRTRVALLSYTAQRDEIMAMLRANDPAVAARLGGLYLTMDGVIGRRE